MGPDRSRRTRWRAVRRERVCPCGVYVEDDGTGCDCSPWGFVLWDLMYQLGRDEPRGRTAEEWRDRVDAAWDVGELACALHRLRDLDVVQISGFRGSQPIY